MFHAAGPSLGELLYEALLSVEEGYDRLAPQFDFTPFRTPDAIVRATLAHAGPARRALDLCAGTGAGARAMLDFEINDVTAVDLSQQMLGQFAGARVRGDAMRLPFATGAFDLITCFGALGHFEPAIAPALFAEVARVLAPGGRFVFPSSRRPPALSARSVVLRGFNAVMHVRNVLRSPPFVMLYLNYLDDDAPPLLEAAGLRPEVAPLPLARDLVVISGIKAPEAP